MNRFFDRLNLSIRTKIQIPFVLIFVLVILLGTFYFIHIVSEMMNSNIARQMKSLSLMVSEELHHQEQRIVFHAQNMAETKKLADQILNTNQVRMLQVQELQALRSERIHFQGLYGRDTAEDDPMFPLVQKGFRGLRITALTKIQEAEGTSLHLVGLAPVPGPDGVTEVILLGTVLNRIFLQDLSRRIGAEIVLFDHDGTAMVGTIGQLPSLQKILTREWVQSSLSGESDSQGGILHSIEIIGAPYKAVVAPLVVNYQQVGAFALMVPIREFMEIRRLLIIQALTLGLVIVVLMSFFYHLIVRGITTPLKELEQASQRMMKGEPVEAVVSSTSDEVGTLARSFNEMSGSLLNREKELRLIAKEFENKTKELDSILKHMAESVVVTNQDYEIEYMNKAAVESFGSHLGKKCYKIFHDRSEPCHPCSIDEVIHKKRPVYQYSSEDHEGRHFEVIAQPLPDMDGSIKVMTLRRDVTERIRRFEEEKMIQKKIQDERIAAIRQVVVSIKHGINNSLTAIFGSLELIKTEGVSLTEQEKVMLQLLESETKKIQDIVSKLSRITEPVVTEYMDDITMIDLDRSSQ
jgi:signal transduction histidine kinase